MKALVSRLKKLVFRPLWTESAVHRARRRGQLLVIMPFVLLAGMTWGFFSAPSIGEGSRLLWSVLGATGFGAFFYLEHKLLPVMAAMADRFGFGALAALVWEVGVVGGLIFLFTSVLGAPVVPAVALAFGVGMTYSLGMEYFVFGSGADHFANLLGLGRGWSGPRGPDYSYAEALEKRGDFDGAVEIYKEAIFTNRRHPLAYLRLADIRVRTGQHEEAIDILRRALATARFTPHGESLAIREIHEIFSTKLGDPARAAPDLARYLERQPLAAYGKWARQELTFIKEHLLEDG